MNLLLASNQISDRRENRTNDFEIDIHPPFDIHYGNYFIVVNEFMYPQAILTIHTHNRDDFSCLASLKFLNYILHTDGTYLDGEVEFHMEKFLVPDGNYSKTELLTYLNQKLYYFGIIFDETVRKYCFIRFEKYFEFFLQSEVLSGGKTIDGHSSSSFRKIWTSKNSDGHDKFRLSYKFNDGLSFIFVDCDKVEPVQLGFTYRSNLLICLICIEGGMGTVSYSPKGHECKLKSGLNERIHVMVNDINHNRIFFNSGKVLLNCSILLK